MGLNMIKLIFFDLDGTLLESTGIKTDSFIELFRDEKEGDLNQIADYVKKNPGTYRYEKFGHIYSKILGRSLDEKTKQVLSERFSELVLDKILKCPFVKGTEEFMEKYSHSVKLFLLSATPANELETIIRKKDIKKYFIKTYGAPLKKAEIMIQTLKQEQVDKEGAVFVGDSMADFDEAKKAGIRFIGRELIREAFPKGTETIKDINELDELITNSQS
ncbi:MAG: HAD-IA family hydrolase [Candidatus Micrarchaeota archaeon]